jgi:2-C-methyl-D-erythritol 4-phosphate cytidylyltransferase
MSQEHQAPLPPPEEVGAIIVAAGSSTRMGGVDKTLAPLEGEPVLARTVGVFEASPLVGAVVVLVAQHNLTAVADVARAHTWRTVRHVRLGGVRRQDSVGLGLKALPPECQWIIVHDGARPLLTERLIEAGLRAAQATGAAVAAVPSADTIKRVSDDGRVLETLDRRTLALVQTPQVFRREVLERAHREVAEDATDDAAMCERLGIPVRVFLGDAANLKITTPTDLVVAAALWRARAGEGA